MRLPLGLPVVSSSAKQFSIQNAVISSGGQTDVFLPSLGRQTAVAAGGTVIGGVFGHESAVAQARIPDDLDDYDPTDEGDGSNFAAPRTSRPAHPPRRENSGNNFPALPPAGAPVSGDGRLPWSKFCIFIPEADLALILECLQNPDQHGDGVRGRLRHRVLEYAVQQGMQIKLGKASVAVHPRIEARHREIVRGVLEYLQSPSDYSNPKRLQLIRDLTQPKIDPEFMSGEERLDPVWRRQMMEQLNEVILSKDVMRQAVMALKITEVLDGQKSKNPGAIFYGPPGTGKTILLRAVADVYKKCGYLAFECNVAKMAEKYVVSLANNLDKFISEALEKAKKEGKIAYIFMDEATLVVKKPDDSSVKSYYETALDVMKKYIGNFPELVFAISTNGDREYFDDALVRNGRLEPIHVPPPTISEKIRLWKFYVGKSGLFRGLSEAQYRTLAKAMPANAQGADVEKLCEKYVNDLILKKHDRDVGPDGGSENFIEDLIAAPLPTRKDVEAEITFESFVEYVKNFDYPSSASEAKKRRFMGFV